jgi:hypothetical protein
VLAAAMKDMQDVDRLAFNREQNTVHMRLAAVKQNAELQKRIPRSQELVGNARGNLQATLSHLQGPETIVCRYRQLLGTTTMPELLHRRIRLRE